MKTKDCVICGTRPDIIKMAPLILKMKPVVIHTGQHTELAQQALDIFNIKPDVSLDLMTKDQTLTEFISACIVEVNIIMSLYKFDRIWVQGDTSTALSGALTAFNNKIPLVHIEAGLRSGDVYNPYPEEVYRKIIDTMATFKFVPTSSGYDNLKRENLHKNAYIVGNTVIDALNIIKSKLSNKSPLQTKYVLATIHRRESFGNDMFEIFSALKELSTTIKVVLPAHPNPNVQKIIEKVGLQTVKPMDYLTFLNYLKYCEFVITDSGGIQEEACSFKKKVIILRKKTERQEIIDLGYGILIKKLEKTHILQQITKFIKTDVTFCQNPYGTGNSANKIINIIRQNDKKTKK